MARNHNQIGQSYSSEEAYNNENVIGGDRVTDSVVTTNRKKETNDDRDGCRNSSTTNIVPNSISSVRKEIESDRIEGIVEKVGRIVKLEARHKVSNLLLLETLTQFPPL